MLRLVILGGIAILLSVIFIFWPASRARSTISNQVSATSQQVKTLQTVSKLISGLPRIDQITVQQPGVFKNYADQAQRLSDKLSSLKLVWRMPGHVTGYSNSGLISDTNNAVSSSNSDKVFKSAKTDLQSVQQLTKYQAEVSKALVNILEYNPADDTKNFQIGSDDTKTRLSLAQSGLANTLSKLESAKRNYSYQNANQLISYIQDLQAARDNLAKSGDTQSWISAVDGSQQKVIKSIQNFWTSNSAKEINLLGGNLKEITKLNNLWSKMKEKYQIK